MHRVCSFIRSKTTGTVVVTLFHCQRTKEYMQTKLQTQCLLLYFFFRRLFCALKMLYEIIVMLALLPW